MTPARSLRAPEWTSKSLQRSLSALGWSLSALEWSLSALGWSLSALGWSLSALGWSLSALAGACRPWGGACRRWGGACRPDVKLPARIDKPVAPSGSLSAPRELVGTAGACRQNARRDGFTRRARRYLLRIPRDTRAAPGILLTVDERRAASRLLCRGGRRASAGRPRASDGWPAGDPSVTVTDPRQIQSFPGAPTSSTRRPASFPGAPGSFRRRDRGLARRQASAASTRGKGQQ